MPSYITLTKGFVAIVDDADFESLNQYHWYAHAGRRVVYARRKLPHSSESIFMHKAILDVTSTDSHVHHLDGNGLNNQRANLLILSPKDHKHTHGPRLGSSSRFKGVSWHAHSGLWHASLSEGRTMLWHSYYRNEEEAARAYDKAVRTYIGESTAYLNFPDETP